MDTLPLPPKIFFGCPIVYIKNMIYFSVPFVNEDTLVMKKIAYKKDGVCKLYKPSKVICVVGFKSYVDLYIRDKKSETGWIKIDFCKNLKQWKLALKRYGILQANKKMLVNKRWVTDISNNKFLLLKFDGIDPVKLTRVYRKEFKDRLLLKIGAKTCKKSPSLPNPPVV